MFHNIVGVCGHALLKRIKYSHHFNSSALLFCKVEFLKKKNGHFPHLFFFQFLFPVVALKSTVLGAKWCSTRGSLKHLIIHLLSEFLSMSTFWHAAKSLEFQNQTFAAYSSMESGTSRLWDNRQNGKRKKSKFGIWKGEPGTMLLVVWHRFGPTGVEWADSESVAFRSGPAISTSSSDSKKKEKLQSKQARAAMSPWPHCNRIPAMPAGQINTPREVSLNATVVRHKSCNYH